MIQTSTASRSTGPFRIASDRARVAPRGGYHGQDGPERPSKTERWPYPLVSVLISAYNWSSVLAHAFSSALGQRYPAFEVIVVGDVCTDDSEQVVRAVGGGRVRWENLPENSGSESAPYNRGIELARGEYVAYLGQDDLWHPDHLAHLVAAVERWGAGLGRLRAKRPVLARLWPTPTNGMPAALSRAAGSPCKPAITATTS